MDKKERRKARRLIIMRRAVAIFALAAMIIAFIELIDFARDSGYQRELKKVAKAIRELENISPAGYYEAQRQALTAERDILEKKLSEQNNLARKMGVRREKKSGL